MPDQENRIVVVDTTPVISLSVVGHLDLLRALYGSVIIPPVVRREVLIKGSGVAGVAELSQAGWIEVVPLQDSRRADLLSDLDRGEAEVIALAQEMDASLVILDERLARRHAKRIGLQLTGTVGVLLKAKQQGLIPAVRPPIEEMQRAGIRLSRPLIEEVMRVADEL